MNDKLLFTIQLCLSNRTLQEILSEEVIYMKKSLTKGLWEMLEGIVGNVRPQRDCGKC
jgi:hypothetical protein